MNEEEASSAMGSASSANMLDPETYSRLLDWAVTDGVAIILNVLLALAILVVGKWIAGFIRNRIKSVMAKRKVDPALISFGTTITYYVLMICVVLAAVQKLGFQTTSLVAIIGAAGLAIGLALQGSLANFAAGILIIMFRPFRLGDFIKTGGVAGTIEDIGVLITTLKSPDNQKIIVPNSEIMSGSITNVTANATRRVDMSVGVSYGDDLDRVQRIILDVLNSDKRVLQEPVPQVVVSELADSSVNFHVRPWTKTPDYWGVYFDFQKTIKQRLDREGVTIPFPQRDVHLDRLEPATTA